MNDMDEITPLRSFRADVSGPSPDVAAEARGSLLRQIDSPGMRVRWTPSRRRTLVAAVAVIFLLAGVGALAASGMVPLGILGGPSAPPENDAALRALFPPLRIGHATELAQYDGRTLFGAHSAKGGYCFSATSPSDPNGEGGHCVSEAEARTLDVGGTVAFAMSGGSIGGYAPRATTVHVHGAGIDRTFAVDANGWWLGVAQLPFN
jgi:hypothetical protein